VGGKSVIIAKPENGGKVYSEWLRFIARIFFNKIDTMNEKAAKEYLRTLDGLIGTSEEISQMEEWKQIAEYIKNNKQASGFLKQKLGMLRDKIATMETFVQNPVMINLE
jgi:hypothetical protein